MIELYFIFYKIFIFIFILYKSFIRVQKVMQVTNQVKKVKIEMDLSEKNYCWREIYYAWFKVKHRNSLKHWSLERIYDFYDNCPHKRLKKFGLFILCLLSVHPWMICQRSKKKMEERSWENLVNQVKRSFHLNRLLICFV